MTYFPDWWTFPLWASFRHWYRVTDPVREQEFACRCAAGITREYMYTTFVKAKSGSGLGGASRPRQVP
jgi:hypothetical protein